jgi:drug/metabolite transporter (DMT)-like permease
MQNKWIGIVYVCSTIGLQVISQLIFKARSLVFLARKNNGDSGSYLVHALFDPFVWIAMACAFLGMITWLLALARLDLSTAYPMVSITFPLVVILSLFFWNEPVGIVQRIGIFLMFSGLFVMFLGHRSAV